MNGLVSCPTRMPHGRPLRGCGRQDGMPATVHCTLGSATTTSRAQAGCCRARRRRWIRRAFSSVQPARRDSLPLSKVFVRLAALALLLVHGHWAACALHVRVCAPEECGEALPLIRRAAAGLTCGPP